MKYTEVSCDTMKALDLPRLIGLAVEHAENWIEQEIYPDDIDDLERAEVARLKGLQHQATFTPEEVVFIASRISYMTEENSAAEQMKHAERVAAYTAGLFKQ